MDIVKVKQLRIKLAEAKATVSYLEKEIELAYKYCNHDWVYVGHGHNCSIYRCSKCPQEKEE